jgi:hypothetical protein
MKTRIVILTVVVSLTVSGLALARKPNPTGKGLGHQPACAPSIIRIEHTYIRYDGLSAYRGWGYSEGTTVAPNIILTHNHFHKADESLQNEALAFLDPASAALSLPFEDLPFVAIDGGTALIYLPNTVSLPVAPIGDRSTIDHLAAGDRLTVCYWDDARERLAQQGFEIVQIKDGVATLADPDRVINPGDSGGGVFFEGRLVGNTWAMRADSHGNPTGTFDVALLPAQVQGMLEMTETTTSNGAQ